MEDERFEEHLREIEERLKEFESKLEILSRREKRLNNLVLRLAAINMAITESLQKHSQINPSQFEKRVEKFLGSLDQEISAKKTVSYLNKIWQEFEEKD